MLNNNEIKLIVMIERARGYVKGEVELNCIGGEWYARDYREDLECALLIEAAPYNKPLITNDEAKEKRVDIVKCCNICGVYYVG